MGFKKDFIFGAATAAFQVEGAAYEDGKGLSIWDVYCQQPGLVKGGHNGDIACDQYHRYEEDIDIMADLGLDAYRYSVAWPRILPDGIGKINALGLDFYDRLTDKILEKGIKPYVTLYHWDLPYELYKKGGWLNRDMAGYFAEYTEVVVRRLSDRVSDWITINEPQIFLGLGYQLGIHAPFLKLTRRDVLTACHNVLLAHGMSDQAIRANAKRDVKVGFAPIGAVKSPATNKQEDIEAARAEMFRADTDTVLNAAWFGDPIVLGKYPEDGLKHNEKFMPEIKDGDMKLINQPLDFYGVNIYEAGRFVADGNGGARQTELATGFPITAFDWPLTPESLYWGARFTYERYHKPIVVTENGMANTDWVMEDGKCHDPQRIDYMSRYLKELEKAADEGVEIDGYFYWSLLDNFEWAEGYTKRFGIVHVDYETQKRTVKDSALWYRDYIKTKKK